MSTFTTRAIEPGSAGEIPANTCQAVSYSSEELLDQRDTISPSDTNKNKAVFWSLKRKCANFAIVCCIAFVGHFSAPIYVPALPMLQAYYHADQAILNLSISFFMVFFSIGLLFLAPLSECFGRRPVYIVSMLLYTITSIIAAFSPHITAFMTFRLLQGTFASVGLALGGGSCSDLFDNHARGRAMACYILCVVIGPAVSPIIGGYVSSRLSWQWVFYTMAILGGALCLLAYLFLQETLYIPPSESTRMNTWLPLTRLNPLDSFRILLRTEIALICLVQSTIFGWIFLLIVMLPSTLRNLYHLSVDALGLIYLTGGLGDCLAATFSGVLSDRLYHLRQKRNHDMSVYENRLTPVYYIAMPFTILGFLIYGWSEQYRLPHWVPLIGYFIVSFGTTSALTITASYLIDSHRNCASSAISMSQFARNIAAMAFSAAAVPMYRLNIGWIYTISSVSCLSMFLVILLVQYKGPKWRERYDSNL